MRLAFTDAFDLRRVQGIDLRSVLTVVLVAHAAGQTQLSGERLFQHVIAGGPAADVADHPAEIGLELAERLVGAFELVGIAGLIPTLVDTDTLASTQTLTQ